MKIYQKKNAILGLAILSTIVFVFIQTTTAQQLKPKEIIYSRLQTNLQAAPTGANQPTIWAVGQDGANDRQITTGMQPRISDDGRFLLFKRFDGNGNNPFGNPYASQSYAQIWVRNLETGVETLVLVGDNRSQVGYSFSPESNRGDFQIILHYGTLIYKMNLDGTNATPLEYYFGTGFPREGDYFPVLRRDDSRIVLVTTRDCSSGSGCNLVTRTLGSELPVDVPNTGLGDNNPSWSNDNQYIGLATIDADRSINYNTNYYPYFFRKISKIKPNGTGRTQLFDTNATASNTNGIAFGTVWTDDNSKIIAAARIGGTASLYAFNTDGGGTATRIPISTGNAPDFVGGIVQAREEQQVVSIAGGVATNGNYTLVDTIGEVIAGQNSSGGSYSFDSGFWAFAAPRKTFFDFDGDGKSDLSVFRPSNGYWYLNNSTTGFTYAGFGLNGDQIAPADYDGDGKTDLAVFRPSNGAWYLLRSNAGFTQIQFGANGDLPMPADFDGDGKAEIAIYRPSSGVWYTYNLATAQSTSLAFGITGDTPTAADYDGDGKADFAVFRPSNGTWYLQRSQLGFTAIQFGASGDKAVPADYDGDGKADLAVWRPSNGVWYLQQSTAGFSGTAFGITNDLPSPADFDGDGKADLGIFRPSSGTWYLQRSTQGFTAIQFGANGDKPTPNAFVP